MFTENVYQQPILFNFAQQNIFSEDTCKCVPNLSLLHVLSVWRTTTKLKVSINIAVHENSEAYCDYMNNSLENPPHNFSPDGTAEAQNIYLLKMLHAVVRWRLKIHYYAACSCAIKIKDPLPKKRTEPYFKIWPFTYDNQCLVCSVAFCITVERMLCTIYHLLLKHRVKFPMRDDPYGR